MGNFKKLHFIWIFILWVLFGSFYSPASRTNSPNIIVLLADDMRYDMTGVSGNSIIQTPNIDLLAKRGTYFSRGYVTTAICPVSRASVLSGQHGRRHGIWGFNENFSSAAMSNIYPILLKNYGYTIGFIGKWGIGPTKEIAHRFDYWKGFDAQGTYNQRDSNNNYKHLTSLMGDQMLEFIDKQNKKEPFNLSVSFKAPHVEKGTGDPKSSFVNDPVYDDLYLNEEWPKLPTSDTLYHNHFSEDFLEGNEANRRYEARFGTADKYQESLARYYRLVHGIDVQIGRLIQKLSEKRLLKNTIIVFTSDNGFYLGEYGFAGKWYGSEVSTRVPFIISGHKSKKKKIDKIVLNIDIAPTILDYANVDIPENMQGNSLKPLLERRTVEWRKEFFYEHLWPGNSITIIPSTRGIIQEDHKYMRYFNQNTPQITLFEEMYQLHRDPFEENNIVQLSESEGVRDTFQQKINRYLNELN